MNIWIYTPPPINALATALQVNDQYNNNKLSVFMGQKAVESAYT